MKNILLIGGSYGIGASLAQILANDNHVTVASRTKPDNALDNVNYITFDASKDEIDLDSLPETIDGFVYFPGSINLRPFKGLKPSVFIEDFNINVMGCIKILQKVLPKIQAAENPSIVMFSTVAVKIGMPFHTSIAISKISSSLFIFF